MLKRIERQTKSNQNSPISKIVLLAVFDDYSKLIAKRTGTSDFKTTNIGHELSSEERREIGEFLTSSYKDFDYESLDLLCEVVAKDSTYGVSQRDFMAMRTTAILKQKHVQETKAIANDEPLYDDSLMLEALIESDVIEEFTKACVENDMTIDENVLDNIGLILLDILKVKIATDKTEGFLTLLRAIINDSIAYARENGISEITYVGVARALEKIDLPENPGDKEVAITELKVKEMRRTSEKRY